ncbi:hypothetical protein KBB25_00355 [Candidatus Gracilibacteria bacterium]|nr:hypothetical protein [Candidatus Gracilibacteria bacterium]
MLEIESLQNTLGHSVKQKSFLTVGKITALCSAIFLAGQTFSRFDQVLADTYGHESIFSSEKAFDIRALYSDLQPGEKIFLVKYSEIPVPKYMGNITIYTTGSTYPKNSLFHYQKTIEKLGFFPEEVLRENLQAVVIGPIGKKDITAYAERDLRYFKIKPQSLSGSTPFHEMSHLIFMHTSNTYWTDMWEEKFGEQNPDNSTYAAYPMRLNPKKNYGMRNSMEDMATIAEKMFSSSGWQSLEKSGKRNIIVKQKSEFMVQLFEKVSDGFLDEAFFQAIQNREILTANDAQQYFEQKRRRRFDDAL